MKIKNILPQSVLTEIYLLDDTYKKIFSSIISQFYYQYNFKPSEILKLIKIKEDYNKKKYLGSYSF